jgi:two-component system, chemotaxis family, CheB/CheR fusion protein
MVVNSEDRSINRQLLTTEEELQSRSVEISALGTQLQESQERQRIAANDLSNVLNSAQLATIFLDRELRIRFFTPATQSLFSATPGDIGRPLADFAILADDTDLLADAAAVLAGGTQWEREIVSPGGASYVRRASPYLTPTGAIEGVVLTFTDVTDKRRAADALLTVRRDAELSNVTKMQFLASASHDLRQPLQTLALLQGLLAKTVYGTKQQELVARVDDTLAAMSGILNTLLDINQIEAGVVMAQKTDFAINELLERIRDEFSYHAIAKNITLRAVACSAAVHSDSLRLEQMLRNLCSNALKYTRSGKVLLGCRRRGDLLSIEIWDTGLGIAGEELGSIFDEYHQLEKAGRERSRGIGLGLSIVKRLGNLLGHEVRVKSQPGRGSMFSIEVPMASDPAGGRPIWSRAAEATAAAHRTGSILVIEDDPEVLSLLTMLVRDDGHRTATAANGAAALALIEDGMLLPDLVLADLNLPNGIDGLEVAAQIRQHMGSAMPVIILTGDISTETLREIVRQGCVLMHKPASLEDLTRTIQAQLALAEPPPDAAARTPRARQNGGAEPVIYVVDDDRQLLDAIRIIFEADGRNVQTFENGEDFLAANQTWREGCLLLDAYLPGLSGLDVLAALRAKDNPLPAIMITGNSEVSTAIAAMKAGATDFIEKPVSRLDLLASVERALKLARNSNAQRTQRDNAARHMASLTPRQKEIMAMVLAGQPSKNIAADLGISQRTVENHRAAIMKKTGTKSLPALARLAVSVDGPNPG